ncbi:flagellar hook-basal body complex protein FliE [Phenylobacterium sp.]|uniref:flagellar hook-basal body complex protein FliE n=1 Tax=Phenylobacterium sp. TaxID=1871053 RepID=UPI002602B622|nr:flagellar hook-basal body complex protein FliE [Phenylobacterium sp.]
MMTALAAAKAYAAAQSNLATDIAGAAGEAPKAHGFGDILKSVMGDAVSASKAAETQMTNQVQGKAQLVDVVTAVANAETNLETVMAIRDQVIGAYQEIMRMPI